MFVQEQWNGRLWVWSVLSGGCRTSRCACVAFKLSFWPAAIGILGAPDQSENHQARGECTFRFHPNRTRSTLSGTLPAELGQLLSWQPLAINFNMLTGPIPTELGQLVSLTSLDISANPFTETLPTELGGLYVDIVVFGSRIKSPKGNITIL
jgi:hypothetical protein